jgi:hypothetical protein
MSYCLNPDCPRPGQNPPEALVCQACGSGLVLQNRYRPLRPLGQGGFGRTFLAVDEDKPSKPKCVVKQFLPMEMDAQSYAKASELFQREALRLDELGHHEQIPKLYAYFEQEQRQYIIQEFIDGNNLARELQLYGPYNEAKALQLLRDLVPVLEFVHNHHVIHRDVKPENVIRSGVNGKLYLVDFGAAKFAPSTSMSNLRTIISSAGFTAPEQMVGKAEFVSDLYSLGCDLCAFDDGSSAPGTLRYVPGWLGVAGLCGRAGESRVGADFEPLVGTGDPQTLPIGGGGTAGFGSPEPGESPGTRLPDYSRRAHRLVPSWF